jgi:DnaJ-class molecular chaperone
MIECAIEINVEDGTETETMTECPWCRGSGKRDVLRAFDLKATMREVKFVLCEACKGQGQVTASDRKRLIKSVSGNA